MQRKLKITMLGAGSAFTLNVARTLTHEVFYGGQFFLMDVDEKSLTRAKEAADEVLAEAGSRVGLVATTDLRAALDGADYVIVSCELNRYPNWIKDIAIPERHGVYQVMGENGGPGGQIHAMRNIKMLMPIVAQMRELCPDAWLLNLTNPMSMLCTYLERHGGVKWAGFCHQVHGTVGVISEQLGFAPDELEAVSAGINHLNWLFDLRRKSTGQSYLREFYEQIEKAELWRVNDPRLPEHRFSLEVSRLFGMYPLGYDNHICEYLPFFHQKEEWEEHGVKSKVDTFLQQYVDGRKNTMDETLKEQHLMAGGEAGTYPFPKDPFHSYYDESVCPVIVALETNRPLYLDAMVGVNNGAVPNLPVDCIVDRPVVVVGGQVRSVFVGELPPGPLEICRRQIALHEMVVKAVVEEDEKLAIQALCLDPYVKSLSQARAIWADMRSEYTSFLPVFK